MKSGLGPKPPPIVDLIHQNVFFLKFLITLTLLSSNTLHRNGHSSVNMHATHSTVLHMYTKYSQYSTAHVYKVCTVQYCICVQSTLSTVLHMGTKYSQYSTAYVYKVLTLQYCTCVQSTDSTVLHMCTKYSQSSTAYVYKVLTIQYCTCVQST